MNLELLHIQGRRGRHEQCQLMHNSRTMKQVCLKTGGFIGNIWEQGNHVGDNLTSKAQKHIGGKSEKQNKKEQLSLFMLEKGRLARARVPLWAGKPEWRELRSKGIF